MPSIPRMPLRAAMLALLWLCPALALAATPGVVDLTAHWAGYAALGLFALAYVFVIAEEFTGLRKSQPVMLAAGAIWALLAIAAAGQGQGDGVHEAVREYLLEFGELLLFLLAAMTYVNAMSERNLFEALRLQLLRRGFGYRWSPSRRRTALCDVCARQGPPIGTGRPGEARGSVPRGHSRRRTSPNGRPPDVWHVHDRWLNAFGRLTRSIG